MKTSTTLSSSGRKSPPGVITLLLFLTVMLFASRVSSQIVVVDSQTNSGAAVTSLTINKPTGLAVGDLMIANITNRGSASDPTSVPAGWTRVTSYLLSTAGRWAYLAYKVADASDVAASNFSFSWGSTSQTGIAGGITAFRGVNTTTSGGIEIVGTSAVNNNTGPIAPAQITTATSNAMVLFFGQISGTSVTFTAANWTVGASAMTQAYTVNSTVEPRAGLAYVTQAVAGATGAGSKAISASARWGGILFSLKSAKYYRSLTTGNWSSTTTWQESVDNSTWVNATSVPDVGDISVTIRNGHAVTLTAGTMTPDLTIDAGGTLTPGSNLLTLNGDFVRNGTLTTGSGGVTIAGTDAIQNIAGFTTTGTLTLTKTAGTATFTGNVNGAGLTINGLGGTLNLGSSLSHTFTGTWTRTAGTLHGGSSTISFSNTTAFSGTGGTFTAGTGTVNYSGASQTVASVVYNNLVLSGSGTKSFTSSISITGNLNINSGVVAHLGTGLGHSANTLTLGGNGTIGGGATFGSTSSAATQKNNIFFTSGTTGMIAVSGASTCGAINLTGVSTTAICAVVTSYQIAYTGATGSPDLYSISGPGITTVSGASLPASPISVTLSSGAPAGTITPTSFTVSNSISGCISSNLGGTVTVNPLTTNGNATTSICAGDVYVWPVNGQSYTTTQTGTTFVSGCNTATLNLTVNPLTTNGSITTSICAGGSYTWPANGVTYTTAQTNTTFVSGCNTATLNLTVNPLTTNGNVTTSICAGGSYTWPANGVTYTTAQTNTIFVSGCNTATLNLTVNPLATNGNVTTSICAGDTYVWPANGQSYTTAQSGTTFVSGCNTATLNLTVNPLTTNGDVTTSICAGDSYVWPANGQSYTTAQSGTTFVSGCNTATLNLTVNPLTTNGDVTTSICAGDTYVWPANGQSYTTAQSGTTFVSGCNTATLNLTITPLTTNGSETVSACASYVWTENGQTYTASGVYTNVVGCNTATLNLTVNTNPGVYYADTDGDGFGTGTPILSCTGQPVGTSTNNTDCAPSDPTKWRTGNFFVDADNDGFNNGFPATQQCFGATAPAGYVGANNGVDCDENNALVNPNASEILGNNIDDNCDGVIDEVTPTSFLVTTSCGITMPNLGSSLFAYDLATHLPEVGPIQGYRFRVTNGATVRTFDSLTNRFTLMNLQGGAVYGVTYTVEVSVKIGGFFRAYGSPCTVNTPAVPNSTFISNPTCGSTLTEISQSIFCVQVPGASGYRFRVRNGATLVGTVDKTTNRFSLLDLGVNNISFGTTYTVDVLLAFGGNLRPDSEYGNPCSITTPATPGTSRVIQPSCGSTINALWSTIFAQQITGAQGYKFVVTNGAQTREFVTANPRFQLPLLSGGAAANTVYTIRVDVLYNSSYVVGTSLCTITTSPTANRIAQSAVDIFEVRTYPNPFASSFKVALNTSDEDVVNIRVYDMLGKALESRQLHVGELHDLELGAQYPSGVYNIVFEQGQHVESARVVKR